MLLININIKKMENNKNGGRNSNKRNRGEIREKKSDPLICFQTVNIIFIFVNLILNIIYLIILSWIVAITGAIIAFKRENYFFGVFNIIFLIIEVLIFIFNYLPN